jgi:hypothetical protein
LRLTFMALLRSVCLALAVSISGPRTSWVFRHGYRVAVRKDIRRTWFICRCFHQHKDINGGSLCSYKVSSATSAAYGIAHFEVPALMRSCLSSTCSIPMFGCGRPRPMKFTAALYMQITIPKVQKNACDAPIWALLR